jgi:tetratricopeptide (TPR) repeat protein
MTCKWFTDALALLLLVCAAATTARGDDAFKHHYEAGLSFYSSEDYESAIKEFQAAYAVKSRPRLLFNIGQAYRNIGNAKQALHYYLLYQALESDPKPGLKSELEGYIAQMSSILAQAQQARRAEDRDLSAASTSGTSTTQSLATAAPTVHLVSPPPPAATAPPAAVTALTWTPPAAEPRPPLYKRGWFWGVVGGTAAAVLVTGLAVGLSVDANSYGGDIRHPTF